MYLAGSGASTGRVMDKYLAICALLSGAATTARFVEFYQNFAFGRRKVLIAIPNLRTLERGE
jgi:hypothetical protein